jgi:hypothetical protein
MLRIDSRCRLTHPFLRSSCTSPTSCIPKLPEERKREENKVRKRLKYLRGTAAAAVHNMQIHPALQRQYLTTTAQQILKAHPKI